MVSIVFSDMDGTFLTPEKTITAENLAILDELNRRGIEFVPCTGRNEDALPPELVAHPAVKHAICCNGALIVDVKTHAVLHVLEIDKQLALDIYHQIRDMPVVFDIFADGHVYIERSRFRRIDEVDLNAPTRDFIKSSRIQHDLSVEELLDQVHSVTRLNFFYHDAQEAEAVWSIIDAVPSLRRTTSLPCNVEVTDVGAHKGSAVEWLCSELGIPLCNAVAFGDNDNDITMLSTAGDGVAMENALPSCKAAADHVTTSCSESGVASYLTSLLAS